MPDINRHVLAVEALCESSIYRLKDTENNDVIVKELESLISILGYIKDQCTIERW